MADISSGFLQNYPVELYKLDTKNGTYIDRDDSGFPLINSNNIQLYRDNGVDNIVTAMQDLTQNKFVDSYQNKWAQAGMSGPIQSWHQQIFDQVAKGIATALLENSREQKSLQKAIQNIYDAVTINGLDKHFDAATQPAKFNLNAPGLPPGFATLIQTQIITPEVVPPTISPKNNYQGFSAKFGFEYDGPDPPDIPDSNYENDYPEKEITEGSGSTKTAQVSIIGHCFDKYINAVHQKVQLLHQGVTPQGSPITANDTVTVTIV